MTPDDTTLHAIVDRVATSLHEAIVLAGRLATDRQADAHEADGLYQTIARATAALQRLRANGGDE